jgi:hypothetical protein
MRPGEQAVEDHREAAFLRPPTPARGQRGQLGPQLPVEVALPHDSCRDTGGMRSRHRLPDVTHRAPRQREPLDVEQYLVTDADRLQPMPPPQRGNVLPHGKHSDPPPGPVTHLDELVDDIGERRRFPHRIPADDRDAQQHAIPERRTAVLAQYVRLVMPQHERRERVGRRMPHQLTHLPPGDPVGRRRRRRGSQQHDQNHTHAEQYE